MLDVKWVTNQTGTLAHGFVRPSTSSLCGQAILPPNDPDAPPSTNHIEMRPKAVSRCGTCSRLLVTMEQELEQREESMLVDAYLEQATQLVIGPEWTYSELVEHNLTSWRESVDRVATALAEERRKALAQRHLGGGTR